MSVSFNFSSQNVLVTGSTKGIGLVIARGYAKSGANVFIHGRSQSDIDKVSSQLRKELGLAEGSTAQRICGLAADLSKADDIDALVKFIDSKAEHLDVLVNNAGIFRVCDFFDSSDEDWNQMFEVNVLSGVRLTRVFLKRMLEPASTKLSDETVAEDEKSEADVGAASGGGGSSSSSSSSSKEIAASTPRKGGNVVFISSECGARGLVQMSPYAASKACQMNITRSLCQLTKGVPNVRVNCLLPGPTWTEGVQKYMVDIAERNGVSLDKAVADYFQTHEPSSVKQAFLDPQEIADTCLFVTSEGGSSMDGACIRCEGGLINTM